MSKTYVGFYYHLVWSTKNREPMISPAIQNRLYAYIRKVAASKNVRMLAVGGIYDHIHLLIKTRPNINISYFVRDIKSLSTLFVKRVDVGLNTFAWQSSYWGTTVSPNVVNIERYFNL